jgi:hypothetical protein
VTHLWETNELSIVTDKEAFLQKSSFEVESSWGKLIFNYTLDENEITGSYEIVYGNELYEITGSYECKKDLPIKPQEISIERENLKNTDCCYGEFVTHFMLENEGLSIVTDETNFCQNKGGFFEVKFGDLELEFYKSLEGKTIFYGNDTYGIGGSYKCKEGDQDS